MSKKEKVISKVKDMFRKTIIIRGLILLLTIVVLASLAWAGGQGDKKEAIEVPKQQGPKVLTHPLPQSGAQNKVKIRLFFPRDGTQNPKGKQDGVTPNWYYYWTQIITSIESPLRPLEYRGQLTTYGEYDYPIHYSAPNNYTYGPSPSGGSDRIYIDRLARGTNSFTGHRYIDCFGETLRHENTHVRHWDEWILNNLLDYDHEWKPDSLEINEDADRDGFLDDIAGGEPYQDYGLDGQPNTGDAGEGNGRYDIGEPYTDIDADGHRDSNNYENDGNPPIGHLPYDDKDGILDAIGTYYNDVDSDSDGIDDEDEICYEAESQWPNNSLDTQDWAYPGSQWE